MDEVKTARETRFIEFDLNKDGSVDAEEIETAVRGRVERMTKRIVRRFDKDRDGTDHTRRIQQVCRGALYMAGSERRRQGHEG